MQSRKTLLIAVFLTAFSIHLFSQNERPWLDTNLSVEDRSALLVEALTLEEKVSQLVEQSPAISRLDIPEYNWWNECLHGVARNGKATVFPQAIGLGATFDPELIFRVASAISDEARAKFNVAISQGNRSQYAGLTFWSPNVNIFRDPRWGRGQETYGEDPYLTSRIGVAFVEGLQGDNPKYLKTAACAKHYVVHSGPEALRHEFNAKVSQKDLFETYMPAFKALVTEAKVAGVMGAYNRTNDFSCSASPYLLTDVLKKQWGFDGYIVSDCGAIGDIYYAHKLAKTAEEASAMAIKAGLQLNCGWTFPSLTNAVKQGLITEAEIDEALTQLLKTRFRLGLFDPSEDNPYNQISPDVVCSEEHAQLACEAAQKSIVMVKNNQVLPIAKDIRNLYIVGPQAANADVLLGNYYGMSERTVNILDGIVSKVSIGTTINYKYGQMPYEENSNPIDWTTGEAKASDACIAVLGINGLWEGEEGESIKSPNKGDHTEIGLPKPQLEFLKLLREDNDKPLIVVLTGGFPMSIPEVYELADAVLYCWYPGEQGGQAVADVIFGDVSPSGRLPFTVPLDVHQLPAYEDYNMTGRTYRYMNDNILFPFGYGLTYGNIQYSNLALAKSTIKQEDALQFSVLIKNDSNFSTEEVVQAYIKQPGEGNPNVKLAGFKRIQLKPGEQKTVEMEIQNSELAQFNEMGEAFVKKGNYQLFVGGTSPVKSVVTPESSANIPNLTFNVK